MKPKLCKAGQQLRLQFDDTYADRDRRSDGWIGDLRHSSRPSDHNPDPQNGVVRATDTDRDVHKSGKPDLMPDIADQLRLAAKAGEKRIAYIIFAGELHHLAWAGAGELTKDLMRTIIICMFLSLKQVMTMVRSLISRY